MSKLAKLIMIGCSSLLCFESATAEIKNVVLILSDDHRYDFMGFMQDAPEFLETPHLDRMARDGVHLANAFVSTSLCSPSRASILTGKYMHAHRVVDNQRPVPPGTRFFPEFLQAAGIKTAMIGKWHMGHDDDTPRPGFDHWSSFKGQGTYFNPTLNINTRRESFSGYNADVLAAQAVQWLQQQDEKPFFLHLAFKAVHYPFLPAKRHAGRYDDAKIDYPETMANSEENYQTQSRWIQDRRYSIHGIDHMETGAFDKDPVPSFDRLYRSYCEAVHSLDENIGRVLESLDDQGLLNSTLVIYMSDNGFALGEHGFYDKRDAFEESIRIPMLAYAPSNLPAGKTIDHMVQNIDVAATIMDALQVDVPGETSFDGQSFWPLLQGKERPWRDHILYEYHWEWNFPATPTLFAIRGERYKYIYYHGVWDHNGFYDLQTDPHERHNLINVPAFADRIADMKQQLFSELETLGGLEVPVRPPAGERLGDRKLTR